MTTKTLVIRALTRTTSSGEEETLNFRVGVNVLVGRPNTGKSKWLDMFDYLMGDSGQPEKAFGQDLADKYDSIRATVNIGDEEVLIERNWRKHGFKGKILVNGEPFTCDGFSDYLLDKLNIPNLHYPKGSPYKGTWPALSWRVLLRHIYRQQRFWGDFADKMPEAEQHACLMLFLGIAEFLFSEQYGDLIQKRKKIFQIEGMKSEYERVLDQISRELIDEREIGVGLTKQSIDAAIRRLESEIKERQRERDESLSIVLREIPDSPEHSPTSSVEKLGESWAELQAGLENANLDLSRVVRRISELSKYRVLVGEEIDRIGRAESAGRLFADLKITHCPACDQKVQGSNERAIECFLCHQSLPRPSNGVDADAERLHAEIEHLQAERDELGRVLSSLILDREAKERRRKQLTERIAWVENQLNTVRHAASSIIPADLAISEMEIGRLQERIRQLQRIGGALEYREKLADEIVQIEGEVDALEARVNDLMRNVNFGRAEAFLSDAMTSYLNAINAHGRRLWDLGRTKWNIRERSFEVTIGESTWSSKLGGTLTLYFLIAYHYALMSLTNKPQFHYPGLMILDFQAKLDDGTLVKDQENFVLEPFVQLLQQPEMSQTQVIAAGAAFEGLLGANRIILDHVWG